MIIRQWMQILDETKQETRRLHDTYKVGSMQAVVPKYLKPSVWWRSSVNGVLMVENPRDFLDDELDLDVPIKVVNEKMIWKGWNPGKVLIESKSYEPLQRITEAGAIAEGVIADNGGFYVPLLGRNELYATAVDAYHALWMSINTKKGTRWEDNPSVWVYGLALVKP